ncbi:hypothetical protein VQ005_004988, partial [Salmonella enterica]|nr:hypothetical protein [Salmonella enterica]
GDVVLTAGGGNLNVAKVNISAANATTLNASGALNLSGATISSTNGAVSAEAQGGGVTLGAGKIAAHGDITLNASGALNLSGANISSTNGAVSAEAQGGGVTLGAGKIAAHGDITLNGSAGSVSLGQGSSLISSDGNIALSGNTTGTTS